MVHRISSYLYCLSITDSMKFLQDVAVDTDGHVINPKEDAAAISKTKGTVSNKRKLTQEEEVEKAKQSKLLNDSVLSLPSLISVVSILP